MSDSPSASGNASDRRGGARQLVCVPTDLHRGNEAHLAVIRDISVKGALLFTSTSIEPGEHLALEVQFEDVGGRSITAAARAVRCTRREGETLWRYSVAVSFDPTLEAHRDDIESLARKLPPIPVGQP